MDFLIITGLIAWALIKMNNRKRMKTGAKYRNKPAQ